MKVNVLYFGGVRELVGVAQEVLEVAGSGPTVADALDALCTAYPGMSEHLPNLRTALEEEFVESTASLVEGGTLALIPPVSGG